MRTLFAGLVLSLLFVVSTSSQSPGKTRSTQLEIQRMLNEWQSRLGLTAWRIAVQLVPLDSLGAEEDGDAIAAEIVYDRGTYSAIIRVESAPRENIEESLIHELTHLKLEAWRPPADSLAEEQTIDEIAQALLRSGNPR